MADDAKRIRKAGGTLVESGATALEPSTVSLDFWQADKLQIIEKGIRGALAGEALSRAAICRALHRIQSEQLYKQSGLPSFQEYLKANRLPFPKSTASEYAKIGRALTDHDRELQEIDFEDAGGLKKLLYLETALQQAEDPEEVYTRLKKDSLRDFIGHLQESGSGSHVRTIGHGSRARTENKKQPTEKEKGLDLLVALREYLDKVEGDTRKKFIVRIEAILDRYRARK